MAHVSVIPITWNLLAINLNSSRYDNTRLWQTDGWTDGRKLSRDVFAIAGDWNWQQRVSVCDDMNNDDARPHFPARHYKARFTLSNSSVCKGNVRKGISKIAYR